MSKNNIKQFNEEIVDALPKNEEENNSAKVTVENNESLVKALIEPKNAVALKLSEKIGSELNKVENQDKLGESAKKVISTAIQTTETKVITDERQAKLENDQVFFNANKSALETAGIKNVDDRKFMERIVKCNHRWRMIYYFLILWWVIGINTFCQQIKPLSLALKIVGIVASIIIIALIVFGIIYGIDYIPQLIKNLKN